jgi:hypothetical protein
MVRATIRALATQHDHPCTEAASSQPAMKCDNHDRCSTLANGHVLKLHDLESAWALLSIPVSIIGLWAAVAQIVDLAQSGKLSAIFLSILGVAVVVTGTVTYLLRKKACKDRSRSQAMTSGWSVRSRWVFGTAVASLVFSVLALSMVVVTGLFQRTQDGPDQGLVTSSSPKPSTSDGVPPTSCPPAGQPGAKPGTVTSLVEPSYPLTVGPSCYKVELAGKIQLEVGGQLYGSVPQGKRLFLLGWADPTTNNSTPEHNVGN